MSSDTHNFLYLPTRNIFWMLCLLPSKIHSEKQFNKPKLPVKPYFPIFGVRRDSHFERKVIISKNYNDN